MEIGRTIKVLRVAKGFSQSEFSKILDITPNYLSLIENDKKEPSLALLKKVAINLDVPLSLLLLKMDSENYDPIHNDVINKLTEIMIKIEAIKISNVSDE